VGGGAYYFIKISKDKKIFCKSMNRGGIGCKGIEEKKKKASCIAKYLLKFK